MKNVNVKKQKQAEFPYFPAVSLIYPTSLISPYPMDKKNIDHTANGTGN